MHTYPCPQGRSSVSAMTSQHSVQQLSRMLTCFSKARRRCLGNTHKSRQMFPFTDMYLKLFSSVQYYRSIWCTCTVTSPHLNILHWPLTSINVNNFLWPVKLLSCSTAKLNNVASRGSLIYFMFAPQSKWKHHTPKAHYCYFTKLLTEPNIHLFMLICESNHSFVHCVYTLEVCCGADVGGAGRLGWSHNMRSRCGPVRHLIVIFYFLIYSNVLGR